MKTVQDIRLENFKAIANRCESQRELSDKLDYTPGYINQLLLGKRNIGEKVARKIESSLRIPKGSLDIDRSAIEGEVIRREISGPPAAKPEINDFSSLMAIASPRTQHLLKLIEQADNEKRLTDDDIKLLQTITERLANDKKSKDR